MADDVRYPTKSLGDEPHWWQAMSHAAAENKQTRLTFIHELWECFLADRRRFVTEARTAVRGVGTKSLEHLMPSPLPHVGGNRGAVPPRRRRAAVPA